METFREAFASRIWPIIKQTFEQWKALDVVKQDDGAIGGALWRDEGFGGLREER